VVAMAQGRPTRSFRAWRPQFIWMDVRLPIMNGLDAARCIRRLADGEDVKIAAITASAFTWQRQEVLEAGMDDFVCKPYRREEILECMARHLGVQYLYADQAASPDQPAFALRPEELTTLPAELRGELKSALVALEVGRIAELIGRISERDAVLGAALSHCADKLAYTPIWNALEAGNGALPEGAE